ncbi:MAG: HK97 gp10 family phage protein [Planctomycetota bacterium]
MTQGLGFEIDRASERDLRRRFGRLPTKVAGRVSRRAVSAGLTPVLREARREVPVDTGVLLGSLGRKTKAYGDLSIGLAGPRIRGKHRGYHGHLVHDGYVAADGTFVPGNPFLERANQAAESQAQAAMTKKLADGIEKEASRA